MQEISLTQGEKEKIVNWYLDFAYEPQFQGLLTEEKAALDEVVIQHFYKTKDAQVVTLSSQTRAGWDLFIPETPIDLPILHDLSNKLKHIFETQFYSPTGLSSKALLTMLVFEQDEVRDFNPTRDHFSMNTLARGAGHWWVTNTIHTTDPLLLAQWRIFQAIRDCRHPAFAQCEHPSCGRHFFSARNIDKLYCSKKCLWQHRAKMKREAEGDTHRLRQRVYMKLRRLNKHFSSAQLINMMRGYLKEQAISEEERDNLLRACKSWLRKQEGGGKNGTTR